jgi:lambda family phage tail tape measure protein
MATRDITIRVGLQGADETKTGINNLGEEADKAFQKISDATKPANDNLKLINSTVEEAKGQFSDFSEHAGAVGRVLGDLGPAGLAAAAALGAITVAIHSAVDAAEEFNQAQRKLDAVLAATGQSAGQSKDQLTELAEGYAHTTLYTAEQVQQSEAILLTYQKIHSDVFDKALQATLDVSTLFDRDLTSSARAVGRALEDPVNGMTALTRAGVMLDPVMKENIKNLVETGQQAAAQQLILDALSHAVGGQSAAQDQGVTGAAHNFSESLKEMKIAIGENIEDTGILQGALNGLAGAFQKLREEIRPTAEEELKEVTARMQLMQSMGTDSFFDGAVANPFYSRLQEQQADLMQQVAAKQKAAEDAKNNEQIKIRQEHADALLKIDQDLNGKILQETQTEQDKIIADTAAFKAKIQNQLLPDKSNQADIDKALALANQLQNINLTNANAKDAEEAERLAEANQKVVDSLQERIKLESIEDPRQKFITGEVDKLNDSATAQVIAQTKQAAAAFYDLQEANKEAADAEAAHDKAVEKLTQEMAHMKDNFTLAKQGLDEWRDQTIADLGGATDANQQYIDIVNQIYAVKLKDVYYKSLQDSKDWSDGAISALHKYSDEATNTSKAAEQAFSTAAKGIEDALTDMVTTGSINMQKLDSVVQSVVQDITRSLIKQNITGPLTGWLSDSLSGRSDSGGSSLFSGLGSIFSSIFHEGGVVGETSTSRRAVPSWLFAGAPRFHDGLMPDEFPAILQRGETVLPKNSNWSGGNPVSVVMNITTPDANGFRASQAQIAAEAARNIKRANRNL